MTEEQSDKPKKLTLGTSRLSLNKTIDPTLLKQNYVTLRSNSSVMVEVKKSRASLGDSAAAGPEDAAENEEVRKRLNIFKKATEQAKIKSLEPKEEEKIGSLSKFGSMPIDDESEDTEATEQQEADLQQQPEQDSRNTAAPKHAEKNGHYKPSTVRPNDEDVEEESKRTEGKLSNNKHKIEEPKKLSKSTLIHMLDDSEGDGDGLIRTRSLASIKRSREKEKRKLQQQLPQEKVYRDVTIPETITVGELASRMSERGADVVRELMKLGIIANVNQVIDADTAEVIVTTLGHTPKRVQESDVEKILAYSEEDDELLLTKRAPVVTVMGHVDHGKTSLLDALKSTDVVSSEAGGITQHIGAYKVHLANGEEITFIDTPGHAAFTEMRTRGAKVTDIVVLVIAADDGINTQTIEAINHAKAAEVPIIVAINKIDKPSADLDRVKNEMLQHELIPEDLGGDIIVVPISALKRINLDKLEEAILLVAEMLDLKANPKASASGVVVESRVDKGKGVVTTILVQRGTLRAGDLIVAGETSGRVKYMTNDKGTLVKEATPSDPVEVFGLDAAPYAGDKFDVVQSEKQARDITEYRIRKAKDSRVSVTKSSSLEDLFLKASGGIGSIKELPIIIKGDVHGSVEAIVSSIAKIEHHEVRPKILHSAVGAINESDIALADASGAIILGFNVRTTTGATTLKDKLNIDIRYYSIIYNLLDDVKSVLSGMLSPIIREEYIGSVDIRQIFDITKVGKIAGSYVTRGIIKHGASARLLRDDIVVHEGKIKTLKRFKEDVKEVRENYECGIAFENYEDMKVGDKVEVFELISEKQKLV